MKGYKAFNKDMTCRDMQYEVGKEYKFDGELIPCNQGYHFCKDLASCYQYYPMSEDTIICKVKALGEIATDDDIIYVTNHIKIISKIKNPRVKSNVYISNSGYFNSGNYNSGNYNSGDCNGGYYNSGYLNSGRYNSGNYNSGHGNSGSCNSGNKNSGDFNIGYRNSGSYNIGFCNSGYYNSGNFNSGVFNTDKEPKIKMFDKESDWTIEDWLGSNAWSILREGPFNVLDFVPTDNMTPYEKENHPEYKAMGGFIKTYSLTTMNRQEWWNNLSKDDKDEIKKLPNFDANKFCECVGIEHI